MARVSLISALLQLVPRRQIRCRNTPRFKQLGWNRLSVLQAAPWDPATGDDASLDREKGEKREKPNVFPKSPKLDSSGNVAILEHSGM